jgi:aquaporin Z
VSGTTLDPEPRYPRPEPRWVQRFAAELVGTAALVFVAVGADAAAVVTGGDVGVAARAIAPALVVTAMIYAIGDTSGAHLNPAVSLAFTARGLFPAAWLVPYWSAQLLGALAGASLVRLLYGDAVAAGVSTPHVSTTTALAVEILLTSILVVVILGTADRARVVGPNAAIAVGATIAMAGLIALPIDGASMNPARSLGPAVISGKLDDVALYVVGPVIGALIAVVLARIIHGPAPSDPKVEEAAEGERS